jgi:response regulator RpfG family c-di-GMP phosphodiesterase
MTDHSQILKKFGQLGAVSPSEPSPQVLLPVDNQVYNRILVVDDEPGIRDVIQDYLSDAGYDVLTAKDGLEALEKMEDQDFDLVITDLSMPNLDGFGVIRGALDIQPLTTVIVLSGQGTFENAIEAVHRGAYDFVAKPIRDFKTFKITVDRGLEHKSLLVNKQNYQKNLEDQVEAQTRELNRTNRLLKQYADELESVSLSFITTLLTALEEKDRYTAGHSRRVTHFAVGAARVLSVGPHQLWILQTAAQLHDMGKLMIDLSYVNKPGPLTPEEWEIMKEHPAMADRFLAPLRFLDEVRPIIRHHHERLDGKGYPDGLREGEIDLLTRVLAAADAYDAMTSRRSYRDPMPKGQAVAELQRCSTFQFGLEAVEALVEFLAKDEAHIVPMEQPLKDGIRVSAPWLRVEAPPQGITLSDESPALNPDDGACLPRPKPA